MSEIDAMYVHIPFCKNICSYCDFAKIFYSFSYENKYLEKEPIDMELLDKYIKENLAEKGIRLKRKYYGITARK